MTSAFDDDDIRGNFVNVNSFNDEDDDVMDNWEDVLDEEEEEEKRKLAAAAEELRKKLEKEKRTAKREQERVESEKLAALMSAKPLSKAEQEQAQLEAAEKAANDLFGFEDEDAVVSTITQSTTDISLGIITQDSVDTYVPCEPDDFPELARRIIKKLRKYEGDDGYQQFIRDLVPELVSEMASDEIKKISNPLVNMAHDKAREEKEAKKKSDSSKKGQLHVQKVSTNKTSNLMEDYINDDYDDYDDGIDFM